MNTRPFFALLLCSALLHARTTARADSTTVASNANTLITTAAAQTSPALATGYSPSQTLILSNAEKWTNLPGTPPNDNARIGPVMGGGSATYSSYELSGTVSTGQSVSPRQAALNLAASTTSTAGYNELNEIRYADSILSASGGGSQYNFSDYRVDALNNTSGTLSSSSPFMIKYAGHHLAYAFTYNFPKFNASTAYVSASPMFLGLEPPDYHSTGTDNQGSTSATASNAFIVGTNSNTAGTFLAMYPGTSGTSLTTVTAANAATTLPARTNVTATAISGATGASYTVSAAADSDNGFYFCKVTNASGTTNSTTVVLTVALNSNGNLYQNTTSTGTSPAPVITAQPSSATVTAGSSVTFSLTASGATSYQWYKIATTHRAAMEAQRSAASNLAVALQADNTLKSSALLSGTFSDIVQGVAGSSGDTGFPATYPTGTTGRGVLFSSLTTAQQTTLKPLIKGLIESYVSNAPSDAAVLLADYESDTAINATYVGYANGTGAADTTGVTRANFDATINQEKTPQNSQHSYIRIDGPRCWVEFVVQNAVLYQSNGFVHYHSIYRDKMSDYGGEFGGFLNGASTATGYTGTTYTRPTFTTQPTSASGSSATFTAAATANVAGSAVTPAYQWYNVSTGAISGATSASYTTSTPGSYYVTATTAYGMTASNVVTFTATTSATAPTITTQPASQSVNSGSSATFTVAATGNGTLTYQWYAGSVGSGTAISGATAASYTTGTAGTYYVVVTNTLNGTSASTTSSAATLTVNSASAPTITTQPTSQSVNAGGSVTFTVAATGSGTLTYQWYFGGSAISGATGTSYTISSVTTANAGSYYVVVTNTVGTSTATTTSATATLTVNSAPTITTQPASQTVVLGNSATFSVTATGTGTLSYQWYKGGVGSGTAISGATSATYTIAQTTSASAGSYYVAVTNSVGTTYSAAATLTLQEPFAAYLAAYGLTGVDPATDADGDNVSNLVEFVLGGNPTASDPTILPTSSYTASGGTNYLSYFFYSAANLGSVAVAVEYSTDLLTWTTATNRASGVTVVTTAYNSSYNATTVTIQDMTGGGRVFARLRATLPSSYTGTISGSSTSGATTSASKK